MPQPKTIDVLLNKHYRDLITDEGFKQALADLLLGLPSLQTIEYAREKYACTGCGDTDILEIRNYCKWCNAKNDRIELIRQEIAQAFTSKEATNATE